MEAYFGDCLLKVTYNYFPYLLLISSKTLTDGICKRVTEGDLGQWGT